MPGPILLQDNPLKDLSELFDELPVSPRHVFS